MTPETDQTSDLRAQLAAHVGARDRGAAVQSVIEAVGQGLGLERLYDEVLTPFLIEVGADWQAGRRAVWEEHLATQIVRSAVEALYPYVLESKARVAAKDVTAVFFCPEEENHDLGLRMLADRFDLRGYDTLFVGAATPTRDMVAAARTVGASVACLSASSHYNRALLRHAVRGLEEALPSLRIFVGGAAFLDADPEWQRYLAPDLAALFAQVEGSAGDADTEDRTADRGGQAPAGD